MAARRPSGKAMLAGAAVLAALGGLGAAGYVAATDDDSSGAAGSFAAAADPGAGGSAPAPEPTAPPGEDPALAAPAPTDTTAPAETPPPTETTAPTEPAPTGDTTPSTDAPATRKTRFQRKGRGRDTPKRFAIPPAREFSGRGNASLGTVDLRKEAVLRWSSNGSLTIKFGREDFPVVAPSATGELIVPPYRFELVRVIAQGNWKISITPQN